MLVAMVPNIISCLRVVLTPAIIFFLLRGGGILDFSVALLLFTVAALTDFWDGLVARKFGVSSAFGAFIDPLADKIFVLGVLAAFVYEQVLSLGLLLVFMSRDLLLTLLRMVIARIPGARWKTSKLAKWKTFLLFIVLYGAFATYAAKLGIIPCSFIVVQKIFLAVAWPIAVLSLYSGLDYLITYQTPIESWIQLLTFSKRIDTALLAFATLGSAWLPVYAPGTLASLVAVVVSYYFPLQGVLGGLFLGCMVLLGWIAATRAIKVLGSQDPGIVVIDEIVAMQLICFYLPRQATVLSYVAAFVVFRILDIAKPFPINTVEQKISGGLGIMLDDLVAAVVTIIFLSVVTNCFGVI